MYPKRKKKITTSMVMPIYYSTTKKEIPHTGIILASLALRLSATYMPARNSIIIPANTNPKNTKTTPPPPPSDAIMYDEA
jgi:hypothetical protein